MSGLLFLVSIIVHTRYFLKKLLPMKLLSVTLLFLLQFGGANSSIIDECKQHCKSIRGNILAEKDTCAPSLTINPSPTVFKACHEGKKKSFENNCISLCAKTQTSIASFEVDACKGSRGKGGLKRMQTNPTTSVIVSLLGSWLTHTFPLLIFTIKVSTGVGVDSLPS